MVLARLFSNSTPKSLERAIAAYRSTQPLKPIAQYRARRLPRRAVTLTSVQKARLGDLYLEGASVYDLATLFILDRRTISNHLRRQGVEMRGSSPTVATVGEMAKEYQAMTKMRPEMDDLVAPCLLCSN